MPRPSTLIFRREHLVAGVVCLLALAAVTLAGCGRGHGAQSGVVARVNGHAILRHDLDAARASARLSGQVPSEAHLLDQLVGWELVREEAQRLGVTVDVAAVDARMAALAEETGGVVSLAADLKSAGLDEPDLRAAVVQVLLGERVQDRKFGDIRASRAQALAFFGRHRELFHRALSVKLADIVVRNQVSAAVVMGRLQQGQPFAAAARQFSQDRGSADHGGVMGWVHVKSLPKPLAAATAMLRVGDTSAPVAATAGVYILKLLGRRPGKQYSFAQVEDQVRRELTRRQRSKALADWVRQSRARADVEIIK